MPLLQVSPEAQARPQTPQLLVVLSCVSQPAAEVQSPKPVLHVPMVHTPLLLHVAGAFGKLQPMPQAPQSLNVVMERSQPLPGSPSQSANPALHVVISQVPLVPHAAAATLVSDAQFTPHMPQLLVVLSAASQPSFCMPLQLPKPAMHVNEHVPLLQPAPVVFGLPAQLLPQVPQLLGVLS